MFVFKILKMNRLFFVFCFISISFYAQTSELSIISWNIQDFGKTKNEEEIMRIAKIVKRADIIAIQEVVGGYGGPQAVARLSDQLNRMGDKWDYAVSSRTDSPKYMTERYAFIWKNKFIKIKDRGRLMQLDSIVYREPFMLDFYVGKKEFSIINYHARRHNLNPKEEIKPILKQIKDSIAKPMFFVGDFNLIQSDQIFKDFVSDTYGVALKHQKTVLKRSCKNNEYLHHAIDNIFYSSSIHVLETKVIDYIGFCDRLTLARELSDHLPVFIKFKLP